MTEAFVCLRILPQLLVLATLLAEPLSAASVELTDRAKSVQIPVKEAKIKTKSKTVELVKKGSYLPNNRPDERGFSSEIGARSYKETNLLVPSRTGRNYNFDFPNTKGSINENETSKDHGKSTKDVEKPDLDLLDTFTIDGTSAGSWEYEFPIGRGILGTNQGATQRRTTGVIEMRRNWYLPTNIMDSFPPDPLMYVPRKIFE